MTFGNRHAGTVLHPLEGTVQVSVQDILIENPVVSVQIVYAVKDAETLPKYRDRRVEGAENQRNQSVSRQHDKLVLEGKGSLGGLLCSFRAPDGLYFFSQNIHICVRSPG